MFEDLVNSIPGILKTRIDERLSEIDRDDDKFERTYRNICEEICMELDILCNIIGVFQNKLENELK